ncbi:hypothetical protein PICMEDRAFT_17103 [Pichia membranifaciens NRRL Y-2026]|uniref:Uncharacterized protein n=1 Tax=Pichia membranifaciens NRRL Y-2026 TaxID=763406 RepID=A0A1E3NI72_9ASCO|nr:hypothetical protein PICMEDRAFT_17103 [Pichia membranifaciens NRRL Y-2026]ODQ45840.1 hypothetical protein PICMEDRAFT_17103 [Pichia membranifaciens NRRL Y-2026]
MAWHGAAYNSSIFASAAPLRTTLKPSWNYQQTTPSTNQADMIRHDTWDPTVLLQEQGIRKLRRYHEKYQGWDTTVRPRTHAHHSARKCEPPAPVSVRPPIALRRRPFPTLFLSTYHALGGPSPNVGCTTLHHATPRQLLVYPSPLLRPPALSLRRGSRRAPHANKKQRQKGRSRIIVILYTG